MQNSVSIAHAAAAVKLVFARSKILAQMRYINKNVYVFSEERRHRTQAGDGNIHKRGAIFID
jgi:hypothetical protein